MDSRRVATAVFTVLVFLVAGAISLIRLQLTYSDAVTDVLWAEDGLFPFCVRRADVLSCTFEAYAGYLLLIPRLLAGVVAMFPMPDWALAANLTAAVVAGVGAAIVFLLVRASGRLLATSIFVALLAVALPLAAIETINVSAMAMSQLLIASSVFLALPPKARWAMGGGALLLLLTAMTTPAAIALVLPLAYQWWRRSIAPAGMYWLSGGLLIGLVIQGIVILSPEERRSVLPTWDRFITWIDATVAALGTLIPGVNFSDATEVFGLGMLPASPWLAPLVMLGLLIFAVGALRRGHSVVRNAAGLILLTGLLASAVPSTTGYVSNRYFVVPVVLTATAFLLLIDEGLQHRIVSRKRSELIVTLLGLIAVILWWPSFPASELRAVPGTPWKSVVQDYVNGCPTNPDLPLRLLLSPNDWPSERDFNELTDPMFLCRELTVLAPELEVWGR